MYVGHGVEIEDDAARLRRRKLEFDADAARRSHRGRPWRRRKDAGPGSAMFAALARWRWLTATRERLIDAYVTHVHTAAPPRPTDVLCPPAPMLAAWRSEENDRKQAT
jgi:hypothetical protein